MYDYTIAGRLCLKSLYNDGSEALAGIFAAESQDVCGNDCPAEDDKDLAASINVTCLGQDSARNLKAKLFS